MTENTVSIFFVNPIRKCSNDVDLEFHQGLIFITSQESANH